MSQILSKARVIVVDDEPANLSSIERVLRSERLQIECFGSAEKALENLRKYSADIVLTDLKMNHMSGLELLRALKLMDNSSEVILMTAFGSVELAVEAMQVGASDFITKPIQKAALIKSINQALIRRNLCLENKILKAQLVDFNSVSCDIIGSSKEIRDVIQVAFQAAKSQANVLIEGESGTGKGVLARYIHQNSQYHDSAFTSINCASIPEALIEAELFGYEPGAFTGAQKRKLGKIELSRNGSLFLDEIGVAPITFQPKLLRFLQDGEFERLGGTETITVSTRVISATNSNLRNLIADGKFREDLFYRLNVIYIRLPALRDRTEDIPLLIHHFLKLACDKNHRQELSVTSAAMNRFKRYSWPGNIRELQNIVERLVILNLRSTIEENDLPAELHGDRAKKRFYTIPFGVPLRTIERMVMEETLEQVSGDKKAAAQVLGVHPRTIARSLMSLEQNTEQEFIDSKTV